MRPVVSPRVAIFWAEKDVRVNIELSRKQNGPPFLASRLVLMTGADVQL